MENYLYQQYSIAQKQELENKSKTKDFLLRLKPFDNVKTINEAKDLAAQVLPTAQEYTCFYVGNAKCTVINKLEQIRICVDTPDEFICYDFV